MKSVVYKSLLFFSLIALAVSSKSSELISNGDVTVGGRYSLSSEILNEQRDILISLPESYQHSVHKYPVVFVLDAEFLFDLTRSISTIRAARNQMPESIIVGITNNFVIKQNRRLPINEY